MRTEVNRSSVPDWAQSPPLDYAYESVCLTDPRVETLAGDNERVPQVDWVVTGPQDQELFLVDAFGLLYRSYYALANSTLSSKGMFDTRAVYGFTMVLLSFLEKHAKGNPVAIVFEGTRAEGQLDFRTAEYPEYKEGRSATPAGVIEAIPWVKRVARVLGLCIVQADVYEADDVIGTLARTAKRAGVRSVIVSADKDFRQLLDRDWVSILRPGLRSKTAFESVTEGSFRDEFCDVPPSRYIDILALIGDTADGLKGVPGIGAKTAPSLIAKYGTIEALLSAAHATSLEEQRLDREWDERQQAIESAAAAAGKKAKKRPKRPKQSGSNGRGISRRHAQSLLDNETQAMLMKKLITILDSVPLPNLSWSNVERKPVVESEVRELVKVLEFDSIADRMLHSADNVPEARNQNGGVVPKDRNFPERLTTACEEKPTMDAPGALEKSSFDLGDFSYVFEASNDYITDACRDVPSAVGLIPVCSKKRHLSEAMLGFALCVEPGKALYVDCESRETLPEALVLILESSVVEKRGWFVKDACKLFLSKYGIRLGGRLFDNRIASELLHSGQRLTDSNLASIYLGNGALDKWIVDGRSKRIGMPENANAAVPFCDIAFRMSTKLQVSIEENGLSQVAELIEFPLIPVLAEMELVGVPCSSVNLSSFDRRVREKLSIIEKQVHEAIPESDDPERHFRPTSRNDVAKLLFDTWKLPVKVKRTSSGKQPVNKRVLTVISQDRIIPEEKRKFASLMLEHREISKIANTYTRSLLSAVDNDGRIRATFVQEASATGRLSTSNPNLQSIPVRSQLGREVRGTVVAKDGFSIFCADYSQIELRIIASLSGDVSLQSAFADGVDVHSLVACKIFNVNDLALVTKDQRAKAKEVNYGIPYGISALGLGQQLGISARDAKGLIIEFHKAFPNVKKFTEDLVALAREEGYAKTMLGRKLPLPLLLHGGPQERRAAGRVAVNMPIQGTQADMIKLAMVRISDRLRAARAKSRMILQVHDELLLEVADDECEAVTALVQEEMSSALPLQGVDVVVNCGIGPTWLAAAHN